MAGTIRYGSPGSRGRYRCADCGFEIRIQDISSMPPCPHGGESPHEQNAWARRRGGEWMLAGLALTALGVGAYVYAVGTRRAAEEARTIAEEGRRLAELGVARAEEGADAVRRSLRSIAS